MPTQTIVKKITGKSVPVLKSQLSTRQFRLSKDATEEGSSHDLQQWLKRKQSVWQSDNVNPFTDKEQQEEILQVLTACNPQLPENLVEFSFKEKEFVPVNIPDQHITLLEVESTCLHVDSPEAKEKLAGSCLALAAESIIEKGGAECTEETDTESVKDVEDEEAIEEMDDDESKDAKDEKDDFTKGAVAGKSKKLMNQFNFCERATITYDNALKDAETLTTPPSREQFSDYATQWIIYDSYQEDFESQEKEKDKGKKDKAVTVIKKDEFLKKSVADRNDVTDTINVKKCLIVERMINQNKYDDILQDFRYYEDPSDEFRHPEGTLLPLWKFQYSEIKKLCVTDVKWNPRYFDLFGVSFGCFNFQKQPTRGCFCLWSLKNPSYPEYVNHTQSGVMSFDFHPSRPYLIAVGLHDGAVAVYDSRITNKSPVYESSHVDNKHCGMVWQVQWGEDLTEGELIFYSVSSDGNVFSWMLMQNQLTQTLVISLYTEPDSNFINNDENKHFKDSGTCIALHPTDHSIFLIGTEEGYIYKCSTAYLSMYLFIYEAHQMPVYRIEYNKYSPDIFVSCSADWTIKIWEDNRKEPLFVFGTASSVGDVKWSSYSSTVLAAVCLDCKVYVFDLNVDKYKAICTQMISSKKTNKLSKISFNWKLPVIVIGDDKGMSQVLKLSPNLRIRPKIPKKLQDIDPRELEIVKLEKLLSLIREPSKLTKSSVGQSTDSSSI